MSQNWDALLASTRISDLLQSERNTGHLYAIFADEPIEKALQKMADHKILSLIVAERGSHYFRGFVDSLDIASFIARSVRVAHSAMLRGMQRFAQPIWHAVGAGVLNEPIWRVLNYSGADESVVVNSETTLRELLNIVCDTRYHAHLHRVGVRDHASKKLLGVVSQSDIIRFARSRVDVLPEFSRLTLKELGLDVRRAVVTCPADTTFGSALEVLARNRVSAVALVDKNGTLERTLAASDLRGLARAGVDHLFDPALHFLEKHQLVVGSWFCMPQTKLVEVIDHLAVQKKHRLWIVDEQVRPSGVVALFDVIQLLRHSADLEIDLKRFEVPMSARIEDPQGRTLDYTPGSSRTAMALVPITPTGDDSSSNVEAQKTADAAPSSADVLPQAF